MPEYIEVTAGDIRNPQPPEEGACVELPLFLDNAIVNFMAFKTKPHHIVVRIAPPLEPKLKVASFHAHVDGALARLGQPSVKQRAAAKARVISQSNNEFD
jgi:hypothetical protein